MGPWAYPRTLNCLRRGQWLLKAQRRTSYVRDTWRNVRGGNPSRIWLACLEFVSQQLEEPSKKLKKWGHLNSEILATTTHRKPEEVSNETGTQVISQTIDKCRVKMIQRELYIVKNLLWKRIGKILGKRITNLFTIVHSQNQSIWMKSSSDREFVPICFWSLIQIFFELAIIVAQIH